MRLTNTPWGARTARALLAALLPLAGTAAAQLSITPITWNVIGLDSNNVNVGPNVYPVGARVCNVGGTGGVTATNITVTFTKEAVDAFGRTAGNPNVNLQGSDTLTFPSLPSGSVPPSQYTISSTPTNCADAYFNVEITRTTAAFSSTAVPRNVQPYRIAASATGFATVRTPAGREIFVVRNISQNRNSVTSFTGPTNVTVGGTYTYVLNAKTATGGYEQLEAYPVFPNTIFQIIDTSTTYTSPTGGVNSTVYADACGWQNDPTQPSYMNTGTPNACVGPANYSGAKAGGDIRSTFRVKILGGGTATVTNNIYDFSGNSWHYNADYGTGVNALPINAYTQPDLRVTKVHNGAFSSGQQGTYTIGVTNIAGAQTTSTITVTDVLPAGLNFVSAAGTDWTCTYASATRTVTCTYASGKILTVGQSAPNITLTVTPTAGGTIVNSASVKHTTADNPDLNLDFNLANNSATDTVLVDGRVGGRVFEDLDGWGDPYVTADHLKSGVAARVWKDNGDGVFNAGTDLLLGSAVTSADGTFSLPIDAPDATYWIAVNSKDVTPRAGYNSGLGQGDVWAQQVSQCDVTGGPATCTRRFGGVNPAVSDNWGVTYNHVARVANPGGNTTGVDFGFNFNTVTTTRAGGSADDDTAAARTVQGSLRQFIVNANAIQGANLMRFVPAVSVNATNFWQVNVTVTLPALTDSLTTIDGTAFSATDGTTVRDTNGGATGAGGSVGTQSVPLAQVDRPELAISGVSTVPVGLDLQGNDSTVRRIAIVGFGAAANSSSNANIRVGRSGVDVLRTVIESNYVGIGAGRASFDCPLGGATGNADGVRSIGADGGMLRGNLIGCHTGKGVALDGAGSGVSANGSNGWTVTGNEIRGNGIDNPGLDGIDVANGSGQAVIERNLITANWGAGIDTLNGTGANTVRANTVTHNGGGSGAGAETAGVRLYGNGTLVELNEVALNYGAGIMVTSAAQGNTLSRNSIYDNGTIPTVSGGAASGQIGIDLLSATDAVGTGTAPFVTWNDTGDTDTGGNGLLNFPVFALAVSDGTKLILTGFARPGSRIEVFVAAPDPSGFGEGRTFLVTLAEGSAQDLDAGSASYADAAAGSDSTNRFRFEVPLSSLSGVAVGTPLTATATAVVSGTCSESCAGAAGGSTSEFSRVVTVSGRPMLTLTKWVRNVTQSTAFGSQSAGRPGDTLEYCIDYVNVGTGVASGAVLTDSIATTTSGLLDGYGAGKGVLWTPSGGAATTFTSALDADRATLTQTALTFNLPDVVAGGGGRVCFAASVR